MVYMPTIVTIGGRSVELSLTTPQSPHVLEKKFHKGKEFLLLEERWESCWEDKTPAQGSAHRVQNVIKLSSAEEPGKPTLWEGWPDWTPVPANLKVSLLLFDSLHYILPCALPFPSGIISYHRIMADTWRTAIQMGNISHAAVQEQLN